MILTNFLQDRKSVRDFKDKSLSAKELDVVKSAMNEVEMEEGVHLRLFENGKIIADGLEGKAGYSGVMIRAPHYISLELAGDTEEDLIKSGMALEHLNALLVREGFGTCWITVDMVDAETKKALIGLEGEKVSYMIALGIPKGKRLFSTETATERKSVQELVSEGSWGHPVNLDTLEQRGLLDLFSSVRYAPSHKNAQPWRFLVEDDRVLLAMKRGLEDERSLVDMGVVLYYVKGMAKELGIPEDYTLLEGHEIDGLKVIASYNL